MFTYPLNDRTELTLLEERHAQELFILTDRNRHYLRRWLPWVDHTQTVNDTKTFITKAQQQLAHNGAWTAGIFYQGQLAGVISYHMIDWNNKKTAIGYWLGEEYQGHGIMTTACRVLVDHAFNELKLNRIEIRAGVENWKSRAIPERLQFVNEGVARQFEWVNHHFIDIVVYAMLAQDWKAL